MSGHETNWRYRDNQYVSHTSVCRMGEKNQATIQMHSRSVDRRGLNLRKQTISRGINYKCEQGFAETITQ